MKTQTQLYLFHEQLNNFIIPSKKYPHSVTNISKISSSCHKQRNNSIIPPKKYPHPVTNNKLIFVEDAEHAGKGSYNPARNGREVREATQHLPPGEFFVHIHHGRSSPQDGRPEHFTQIKSLCVIPCEN